MRGNIKTKCHVCGAEISLNERIYYHKEKYICVDCRGFSWKKKGKKKVDKTK